jgi:hypothetical protein
MARTKADVEADLYAVRCAIRELVAGKRKVAVQIAEKAEQFERVQLPQLREYEQQLIAELATFASTTERPSRILRSRFSKGL